MIITFGEALLRLTPPRFGRLEQATSFDVEVGGAELNTGVGLARLGHDVRWVSAVPASPLGAMMRNRVRATGIDDRHVVEREGRAGLYFLEEGAAPRAASIVYDRAGSSMALLEPGTFDWNAILSSAAWFHVTGITAALSVGTRAVVKEALVAATTAGVRVSFDINYRAKLWSVEDAGQALTELLPHADLLMASENDAKMLFGIAGDFPAVASQLCERFGLKAVATMRREATGLWKDRVWAIGYRAGHVDDTPKYDVEVVDRIGTGDAFTAGVIDGMLRNDFASGLDTGAAMGALAHTIRGDLPLLTKAEIDAVIAGDGLRIRR